MGVASSATSASPTKKTRKSPSKKANGEGVEYFTAAELTESWWENVSKQMQILVSLTLESVKDYAVLGGLAQEEPQGVSDDSNDAFASGPEEVGQINKKPVRHSTAVNCSGSYELFGYDFLIDALRKRTI